jgi:hypothetical protein
MMITHTGKEPISVEHSDNTHLQAVKETARTLSISKGDCGILIQQDGKIRLFQHEMPIEQLRKPIELMSPQERAMLENGRLLSVLAVVASSPELQETIANATLADDPGRAVTAGNSNAKH